jgi:hypothetical protein
MDSYNLEITQGEAFSLSVTAKDDAGAALNLSGYSVTGGIKYRYSDTGLLAPFSGTIASAISGVVSITMTPAQTAALPITQGVYGVEIYSDSNTVKLLNGYIFIYPEVIL